MGQDIETMVNCYLSCTKTINHCLETGGEHASPEHINLLMDCAKICNLTSDFACRGSANHKQLCQVCAEICRQCAEQCEQLAGDDEVMKECAEMCRTCAATCEQMSS